MAYQSNIAGIAQHQLAVNDWLATKKAYEAEAARQKKSGSWGSIGRFVGAIGGTLLGIALAPFTGGTSLAFLGTTGMAALGAGIGSGTGTALGQQWAGGMHGQRTSLGQSKNPLTGEMQDIRDPEVERQFEKQQSEFSDQQRNLRTTRALTDAASAYFMPQAMAKAPQGLKTTWNKFAGNVLGNPDARFAVPGVGGERQIFSDPTSGMFKTGRGPAGTTPSWNPLDSAMGPPLPKTFQGGGGSAEALIPKILPTVSTAPQGVVPGLSDLIQNNFISAPVDKTQSFIEGLSNFGTIPINVLNNKIKQNILGDFGIMEDQQYGVDYGYGMGSARRSGYLQ